MVSIIESPKYIKYHSVLNRSFTAFKMKKDEEIENKNIDYDGPTAARALDFAITFSCRPAGDIYSI